MSAVFLVGHEKSGFICAAAVKTLLNSARLNGHDPYAYMKDVLLRLPTHKMSAIGELLPHRWQPRQAVVIA
jgi:transposase